MQGRAKSLRTAGQEVGRVIVSKAFQGGRSLDQFSSRHKGQPRGAGAKEHAL